MRQGAAGVRLAGNLRGSAQATRRACAGPAHGELTQRSRGSYRDLTMAWLGVRSAWVLGVVALAVGCKAEQGGLGTASSAGESSSGAGTTEADGAASSGSSTNAGSGDATVGSSTSGSGTGPADGTSTTGDDPPPPESSGSSAGETGTPVGEGEDYGPCAAGSSCSGPGSYCFEAGGQDMCLPACEGGNPSCPDAPPDNGSLVECIEIPDGTNPHCMLNCAGGTACPEGTTCIDLGGIFRCLWP